MPRRFATLFAPISKGERNVALEVFDYRTDIRNVVITPEIRSRFRRMQPGERNTPHTHDLGHEVFLMLEGEVEFDIAGSRRVLSPGQLCVARRDQMHSVRCVSETPATYYLSVTPHIEPTHTHWDADGQKLPPRYGAAAPERDDRSAGKSTERLADEHVAAARGLAEAAARNADAQAAGAAAVGDALQGGDRVAAKLAVDGMWREMYRTFRAMRELEDAWNELTPRFGDD